MPRIKQYADKYAMKDLGDHIKGRMREQGIRQADVAVVLGLQQAAVSRLLLRPEKIPAASLRKIATIVKLDPAVVMKTLGF